MLEREQDVLAIKNSNRRAYLAALPALLTSDVDVLASRVEVDISGIIAGGDSTVTVGIESVVTGPATDGTSVDADDDCAEAEMLVIHFITRL